MKFDHHIGSGYARWTEGEYTPGQIEALSDFKNSFILLSGAYRSGKTEIGGRLVWRHATQFPGSKVGVFRQHLANIKKSTLLTVLQLADPEWIYDWSNSDLVATLKNGSTITFMGCEFADRIGSIELTMAFIDEAHEVSQESRGMIAGRLSGPLVLPPWTDELPIETQAYLRGTVDIRQMFLACNPKAKTHSLYKDFIESPKPGHISYSSNSISNPNLPEVYLFNNLAAYVNDGDKYPIEWIKEQIRAIRAGEKPTDGLFLKKALTPFGQRNLLGLWVNPEGVIYSMWDEEKHFVNDRPNWGEPGDYYGAVDWGFQNPRVVIASSYGQDDNGLLIEKYWSESGNTPTEMMSAMLRLQDTYDVSRWYLPPDRPDLIKLARQTLGASKVRKAKNAVLSGIDAVSRRLSRKTLLLLNDGSEAAKLARDEMSGYEWKAKNEALKDEPIKENDHYPDAIRYLVYSLDYRKAADKLPDKPIVEAPRTAHKEVRTKLADRMNNLADLEI